MNLTNIMLRRVGKHTYMYLCVDTYTHTTNSQILHQVKEQAKKTQLGLPWLVWLNGLCAGLRTKGQPDGFPVRTHAWVAGQMPNRGV